MKEERTKKMVMAEMTSMRADSRHTDRPTDCLSYVGWLLYVGLG